MNKFSLFRKITLFLFFLFVFSLVPLAPTAAQSGSATLFLSPGSGTYTTGRAFTVNVMVNSGGSPGINAAEGSLTFDNDLVTVSSVSDSGSIFKLWTTDPTFSNAGGTITFGGGAPGAYTGNAGKIFSITFSAKSAGTADVEFTNGIILAADGKGSNVFSGFGQGRYVINEPESREEEERIPPRTTTPREETRSKSILPPKPDVSSPTHPENNIWYQNNEPLFEWKLLSDLSNISYAITDEPEEDPGYSGDGIGESKKYEPIDDGEWYFHIKYQNKAGWGPTGHYKFMVDSTPPRAFSATVNNGGDPTDPAPKIVFGTIDETSGVAYYDLVIDGSTTKIASDAMEKGYFKPSPLPPGEHEMTVVAADMAGNNASSTVKFFIEPLKPPVITDIPNLINRKEQLVVRGTSFYSNVAVVVSIAKGESEAIEAMAQTDENGDWSYFHPDRLDKGVYEVRARLIDKRGAQSLNSVKNVLTVISPSIIDEYGLWIILALLLAIAAMAVFILYQRQKHRSELRRILSETLEMKRKLGKIFAALREEADELIELADKQPGLSEAERRIKEKLQESLDISEEFINKEVEDVEKEINLKENKEKE